MEKTDTPEHLEEGKAVPSSGDTIHEEFDYERNRLLNKRLDLRILPLCSFLYLLNFLDRGNIANAKVLNQETGDDLLQKTGMTASGYSLTVTLFSLAYTLFEVPSNWIMKHYVRPSIWLATLLGCWGALTLGFAGVQNYATVLVLRLLIGVFEAGFFPGIVYLITIWYRHDERSVRIAVVIAFCNLAGAFGGCIAYGLGTANGGAGLEGFRWLFILEGTITMLCVIPTLFVLPDYPARAKFLSPSEKKFAEDRVKERGGGYSRDHATRKEILETFFSPRMLAHYLVYIANVVTQGSFTFFTPTLVTGLGYSSIQAQLLTVPPWVVGFVVAILVSYSADRFNARGWHITVISTIGGAGWLTAGLLPSTSYVQRYGALVMAATGAFPAAPLCTSWVTVNSPSLLTIPFAIALHNSCAGIGQIIAQWIWLDVDTGNFTCAACNFFVAIVAFSLRIHYGRMNRNGIKDARGEKRVWSY
ncbi:MFS transporter [Annulohypoxylon maeteangense]|uniref:MFS transporter n=1 Tax=Annulohypoxylon maeteangense TaxID=1927788 RepID=UPI00200828B6|nr:MFS transporter [Annulohypoxylon maeteangense]KAI0883064.1 MFS transporter [Annulohypoxylon maeteangense]